jgi:hypothetical protein
VMLRIYSHPILLDGPLPTCSPVPRTGLGSKEIPAAVLPGEHVAQTVMNQGLEILPALTSLKAAIFREMLL